MDARSPQKPPPQGAADLLDELHDAFPNEQVTVQEFLERLEGRAFGLLLLLLALPMCIPNIPGISTIFGVLLVAPALQMILGQSKPWLPARVRAWSFQREHLQKAIRGATPWLRRIERYIRPRWTVLTRPPVTIFLGLQTLFMAFVLMLPIPLGNWPPAMTIAMTALALLQRDGLLVLLAIPAAAASTLVAYAGIRIGIAAMSELGQLATEFFSTVWPF
jgi:hypothetical protein